MRRGDISNKPAPLLVFNVDNLLFKEPWKYEEKKTMFSIFKPDSYFDRTVNLLFVRMINSLWLKDFSIILQTSYHDRNALERYFEEEFDFFYYSKLIPYRGVEVLRQRLSVEYLYYIDNDRAFLSKINHKGAIHVDDLMKLI